MVSNPKNRRFSTFWEFMSKTPLENDNKLYVNFSLIDQSFRAVK